jgi:hypothetical protein
VAPGCDLGLGQHGRIAGVVHLNGWPPKPR